LFELELPFKLKLLSLIHTLYSTEMPGRVHERVSRHFGFVIRTAAPNVEDDGSSTLYVTGGTVEPDGCYTPLTRAVAVAGASDPRGNPYPSVVLEIAVAQPLGDVLNKIPLYFSIRTDIQIVFIISVWGRRANGTAQMLAMRFRRANVPNNIPDQLISFGTASLAPPTIGWLAGKGFMPPTGHVPGGLGPLVMANTPGYSLTLPTAALYHGVATGVPAMAPINVVLDLFDIQTRVMQVL